MHTPNGLKDTTRDSKRKSNTDTKKETSKPLVMMKVLNKQNEYTVKNKKAKKCQNAKIKNKAEVQCQNAQKEQAVKF